MIWWKGDIKSLIEICTITISQLFYTIYYGTYFAQLLDNKRKKNSIMDNFCVNARMKV